MYKFLVFFYQIRISSGFWKFFCQLEIFVFYDHVQAPNMGTSSDKLLTNLQWDVFSLDLYLNVKGCLGNFND
jgi:hypothetical protein